MASPLRIELVDEALAIGQPMLRRDPRNRQLLDPRSHHLRSKLGMLMALRRHQLIDATADELANVEPDHAASWRKSGELLWDAAKMVAIDTTLTENERQGVRNRFVQHGAANIRRAFRLGGGNLEWFDNPYFDRLREHPEFAALVAELRARAVDGVVAPDAATGR